MLIKFFSIAFTIFLLFRIGDFIINRLPFSSKTRYHLNYLFPIVELVSWFAYIILITWSIYQSKNYFALISITIVFLLLFVPAYMFVKDFTIGLFLKIQNRIINGDYIEIDSLKGDIKKAGYFNLEIIDNMGNISSIPYHLIQSKIIKRQGDNQNLEKVHLIFTIQETSNVNDKVQQIQRLIMSTPWCALSQKPLFEEMKNENGKMIITFAAYSLDESYAENIMEMVNSNLKSFN